MKISKLAMALAILAMPLIVSCGDGGDAFDVSGSGNTDPGSPDYTYTQEHITDLSCDPDNECPEELSCWGLEGMEETEGPLCVDPNPAEWFCEEGEVATILESYPPSLHCDTVEEELPPDEPIGPAEEPTEPEEPIEEPTDPDPLDPANFEDCDIETPCPEGFSCWNFPNVGTKCTETSPMEWYCEEGTTPVTWLGDIPGIGCLTVISN